MKRARIQQYTPDLSKSGELRIAAIPSITVRPHRHICGLNARVDARVDESAVDEAAELS